MLKRFFELKPFLNDMDEELICNLPSGNDMIRLQKLLDYMKQFESITKRLQDTNCNLSDVQAMFDMVITSYLSTLLYEPLFGRESKNYPFSQF